MTNEEIKNYKSGHRLRVKEKFLQNGFSGWQEYEILEFALFFAFSQKDTKELAKKLIEEFGSLRQVVDADFTNLSKMSGIGRHCAVFINFLRKFAGIYFQLKIQSSKALLSTIEAVNYLSSSIGGEKVEKFCVLILSSANKVTQCIELETGTVNASPVIPRKIAETALKYKAVSIIIAHNHPGGNLKPSQNDINDTIAVKKALEAIDVSLLDHIIVCNEKHFSFKDYGLL
jgi:DNA repair protein RadC